MGLWSRGRLRFLDWRKVDSYLLVGKRFFQDSVSPLQANSWQQLVPVIPVR